MYTAKDLSNLIQDKNKEMEKVLDRRVDEFVKQFKEAISDAYNNGNGYKYAGCSRVGIAIEDVDLENLKTIEFDACDWILAGSEDFERDHEMMTFWDFINQPYDEWASTNIAGQINFEIYDMRYLVTEFEKRGFKCYIDAPNGKLVVVFEI